MKLNSFLTVTALSIHCSYLLASKTNSKLLGPVERAQKCETLGSLEKLMNQAIKSQEPLNCWPKLVGASKFKYLDKKFILEAAVNQYNSYLRHMLWKMIDVLLSVPTENGGNAPLTPFSIDKKENTMTIGSITIMNKDLTFLEKEHLYLLLSYFWGQGWLVSDGNIEELDMIDWYTHHILVADNPELLKRLLDKTFEIPNHVMNKLGFNIHGDLNINDAKKFFLRSIIWNDSLEIYNFLIAEWYGACHIPCTKEWLEYIFEDDAVKIFGKLECTIGADELQSMRAHKAYKILTFSLDQGIHLSVADACKLFGNEVIETSMKTGTTISIPIDETRSIPACVKLEGRGDVTLKSATESRSNPYQK